MEAILRNWRTSAKSLSVKDSLLSPLIKTVGPPALDLQTKPFQALCEAILSQQLAPKASQTIIARFTDLERPFPKPASILYWSKKRSTCLRKAGVSPQKSGYLLSLSEFWQDARWRKGWESLSDAELVDRLTEVKGIGTWTAQMFLIFSLGRQNVLPVDDYGVRRGVHLLLKLSELPSPKEIPGLVSHWEGHYSVGCWYLWKALDRKLLG